jgi:hypothetical protein
MHGFVMSALVAGYLIVGVVIAAAMNAAFDLGGSADPAAGAAPALSKWIVLPGIVLLWPAALFLPLIFVLSWIKNGSH